MEENIQSHKYVSFKPEHKAITGNYNDLANIQNFQAAVVSLGSEKVALFYVTFHEPRLRFPLCDNLDLQRCVCVFVS